MYTQPIEQSIKIPNLSSGLFESKSVHISFVALSQVQITSSQSIPSWITKIIKAATNFNNPSIVKPEKRGIT